MFNNSLVLWIHAEIHLEAPLGLSVNCVPYFQM
jgi:hypothetical protein